MDRFVTDLARFAATGSFVDFSVGARLTELVAAKGEPEWSARVDEDRRWPHWFCYGGLEIVFCRCRLLDRMFVPAWRERLEIPGTGREAGYTVTAPVTEPQLAAALGAGGTERGTQWPPDPPGQRTIRTEPSPGIVVEFVFAAPEDDEGGDPAPADWPLHQASTYGLNHGACPEPDPGLADDGYGA